MRRLKQTDGERPSLSRTAVVFKRRLPYIYLAREVFGAAGVPYQTLDALPLAAEPYAAAVDLVFECVSSGFSGGSLVALLRSPHFRFETEGRPLTRRAINGFDRRLREAGYLGGLERLGLLIDTWMTLGQERGAPSAAVKSVATVALALARELASLVDAAPSSQHLRAAAPVPARARPSASFDDPLRDRHLRARAAILAAIDSLRDAHRHVDDRTVDMAEIVAAVRRWIEGQTFAPRAGARRRASRGCGVGAVRPVRRSPSGRTHRDGMARPFAAEHLLPAIPPSAALGLAGRSGSIGRDPRGVSRLAASSAAPRVPIDVFARR